MKQRKSCSEFQILVKTNAFVIFDVNISDGVKIALCTGGYISDGIKIALSTRGLRNINSIMTEVPII